ncbi:hypothetical protein J4475_00795 [Candidatus Woesearchaeota archaeon]|nr:hypothetical protein [Candidatus Woesearchaeota archaeon]
MEIRQLDKVRELLNQHFGIVDLILLDNRLFLVVAAESRGLVQQVSELTGLPAVALRFNQLTSEQHRAFKCKGVSLILNLDSRPYVLFTYTLHHLPYKDKIRFYYALKGRDGKSGMLAETKSRQLAKGVLAVQPEHQASVEEFLKFWKCSYTREEVRLLR